MKKWSILILLISFLIVSMLAGCGTARQNPDGQNPGKLQGRVISSDNAALSGVTVTVYNKSAASIGTAVTDTIGAFTFQSVPAGTEYRLTFVKDGYAPVNYANVTVMTGQTVYLEAVMQLTTDETATVGSVSGRITNALTGEGADGFAVSLRTGMNATSGAIVAATTTATIDDVAGVYSFTDLPGGNYTAEVSGTGFITAYFTVVCVGGADRPNQDYAVTMALDPGQTRIVLTWGEIPDDLDSHLTGPRASGDTDFDPDTEEVGRFHIYYENDSYVYNSTTYAGLDVDDTTSYGPETVTIYNQGTGLYRYSVHDFSNNGADIEDPSDELAGSGATVKVYRGSALVATFHVPQNVGANLWTVFELNGSTITPINTMTYVTSTDDVRSLVPDAGLFDGLPGK